MNLSRIVSALHHRIKPHVISDKQMDTIHMAGVIKQKEGRLDVSEKTLQRLETIFNRAASIPRSWSGQVETWKATGDASPLQRLMNERHRKLDDTRQHLAFARNTLDVANLGPRAQAAFGRSLCRLEGTLAGLRQDLALDRACYGSADAAPDTHVHSVNMIGMPINQGCFGAAIATTRPQKQRHIDVEFMSLREAVHTKLGNRTISNQSLNKIIAVFETTFGIPYSPDKDAAYPAPCSAPDTNGGTANTLPAIREQINATIKDVRTQAAHPRVNAALLDLLDNLLMQVGKAEDYWNAKFWSCEAGASMSDNKRDAIAWLGGVPTAPGSGRRETEDHQGGFISASAGR